MENAGNLTASPANLTTFKVPLSNLILYCTCIVEGVFMIFGNALLCAVVLSYEKLRRKELVILAGLAFGDLVYGKVALQWYSRMRMQITEVDARVQVQVLCVCMGPFTNYVYRFFEFFDPPSPRVYKL